MHPPYSRKIITHTPPGTEGTDISYHTLMVRVPLFEVDIGMAVYHGNYFHLFEAGREDFLRKIGFPYREFMNRELHLSVVESSCTYRRALRYDDEIRIHTGIKWLRRRSVGFSQLIYRENDQGEDELCTRAEISTVCVRFSGRPTTLPDEFRNNFGNFAEISGFPE
ncbi:MAG: thioesterase family protein [Syntrophobacteraceae bacterium]